jgi:3-isopropylmalate dehydrogenase
VDRVLELAFKLAAKRRGLLTLVDKANVLETSRLWREAAQSMAAGYPGVTLEFMFVDKRRHATVKAAGTF